MPTEGDAMGARRALRAAGSPPTVSAVSDARSLTALEWLEADGLGGFASGTVSGARTRRYHALLLAATTPPTGRMVLVNGLDVEVETGGATVALSGQRYTPDVTHPDGASRIVSFEREPWPRWRHVLGGGLEIEHDLFVPRGGAAVVLRWRLLGAQPGERAALVVRPFFSGRDYHALHHRNPDFRFEPERRDDRLVWTPYPGVPAVHVLAGGEYRHDPQWYRGFQYDLERERGLDFVEDLAAPGSFRFDLDRGEAVLILAAEGALPAALQGPTSPATAAARLAASEERRRRALGGPLERAAEQYLVKRGDGLSIVAGYPWFTDWGRDTFIALRGLVLATGRLDAARDILLAWSEHVSLGMLPNRFPDGASEPEYNSVDASLWYVVAVHDFLRAASARGDEPGKPERRRLERAVEAILDGYARGTRYGIRLDADGLLACGVPGVQLTWMDVKIGDWVVTPRAGKPVEVQALWLNALALSAGLGRRWRDLHERGLASFGERFWNPERGCLFDVVDVDHRPGAVDPALRPNQVLAVGGLPHALLEGERARRVVDAVESRLWTPLGPRSLAADEPGYARHYLGGVHERDSAYHQGTVWPWLAGPFVEAWVRVRGGGADARREARRRFVLPLLDHLEQAGLGHLSEIADAEAPYAPRGCPFQAWSLGELLRLERDVVGAP